MEDIIGKTAFELGGPGDGEGSDKERQRRYLESGSSFTVDFQIPGDGGTCHFLMTRAPYRDPGGNVIGVIGISRDITQYRGIEERAAAIAKDGSDRGHWAGGVCARLQQHSDGNQRVQFGAGRKR